MTPSIDSPAFPSDARGAGMTLRAYIATKVFGDMIGSTETFIDADSQKILRHKDFAEAAVHAADALIAELAKRQTAESDSKSQSAWQPIETAPKIDAKLIVGKAGEPGMRWVSYAQWRNHSWVNQNGLELTSPTHWMPLPEAPR